MGYIDKDGNIVVPVNYYGKFSNNGHTAFVNYPFFHDGLTALINKDGKFGYIDKRNKTIIPFEYDDGYIFSDGIAAVKKGSKWGFIDKSNKEVIPFAYDSVGTGIFIEDLLSVHKNGKWGFIDKKGNTAIPF